MTVIRLSKRKPEMHQYYWNAYIKALNEYNAKPENEKNNQSAKVFMPKLVFYGVKTIITQQDPRSYEEAVERFQFIELIQAAISTLTPQEFINIFPIEKNYDGAKYEMKDYFYTRDYMNTLDQNEPIGKKATELMWEYQNWDVNLFTVESLGAMSDIRKYEGKPSVFEEWAEKEGIETHTMISGPKGEKFIVSNKTGKTTKVKKKFPRYLRLIKK